MPKTQEKSKKRSYHDRRSVLGTFVPKDGETMGRITVTLPQATLAKVKAMPNKAAFLRSVIVAAVEELDNSDD